MEATGAGFDSALKEAQELGFAEADPTSDVEGYDARAKLVILTQAGWRVHVCSEQIPCAPVLLIDAVEFGYARELNCTIRQISIAQKDTKNGLRLLAAVRPTLVPLSSLTAHVQRNQNLVIASGAFAGPIVLSGFGAGGDPTAVPIGAALYRVARAPQARPADTGELARGRGAARVA